MSCADDEEFSQPGEDDDIALEEEEAKLKAQLAQLQRKRKNRSSGGSLPSESIYAAASSSSSTAAAAPAAAAAAAAAPSGSGAVTVTAGASASHNNQTVSINGTVIHFNGPVQFTALQRMRSHITRQRTKGPVWKPVLKECFLNRLSEAAWRKFFDSTKPSHQAAFRGSHKAKSLQKTGITVSTCR